MAELTGEIVDMTVLTDGNDHTCAVLPRYQKQEVILRVPLAALPVEVDTVSVVVSRATCSGQCRYRSFGKVVGRCVCYVDAHALTLTHTRTHACAHALTHTHTHLSLIHI